jgi:hypothetical protein
MKSVCRAKTIIFVQIRLEFFIGICKDDDSSNWLIVFVKYPVKIGKPAYAGRQAFFWQNPCHYSPVFRHAPAAILLFLL